MAGDREAGIRCKSFQIYREGSVARNNRSVAELLPILSVPLFEFAVWKCCHPSAKDYERPSDQYAEKCSWGGHDRFQGP